MVKEKGNVKFNKRPAYPQKLTVTNKKKLRLNVFANEMAPLGPFPACKWPRRRLAHENIYT